MSLSSCACTTLRWSSCVFALDDIISLTAALVWLLILCIAFDTTDNSIGDAGATAVAAGLENNSTLDTLYLSRKYPVLSHGVDIVRCRYHRVYVVSDAARWYCAE